MGKIWLQAKAEECGSYTEIKQGVATDKTGARFLLLLIIPK